MEPAPGIGIEQAVSLLSEGGLVAFPTETVWGLGASAASDAAVERLAAWKGRPADTPLSVLVTSVAAALALGCRFDAASRALAEAFWPGPLTLVLPCESLFAKGVARADGALGLRCSAHPRAAALAAASEEAGVGPITATSLNASGSAPAVDVAEARELCDQGAALLDPTGEDAWGGVPSSVLDCCCSPPRILREGAVSPAELERVLNSALGEGAARKPLSS